MKKISLLVLIYLFITQVLGVALNITFDSGLVSPSIRMEVFTLLGPSVALLNYSMIPVYIGSSVVIVFWIYLYTIKSNKAYLYAAGFSWFLAGGLSVGFLSGV